MRGYNISYGKFIQIKAEDREQPCGKAVQMFNIHADTCTCTSMLIYLEI